MPVGGNALFLASKKFLKNTQELLAIHLKTNPKNIIYDKGFFKFNDKSYSFADLTKLFDSLDLSMSMRQSINMELRRKVDEEDDGDDDEDDEEDAEYNVVNEKSKRFLPKQYINTKKNSKKMLIKIIKIVSM